MPNANLQYNSFSELYSVAGLVCQCKIAIQFDSLNCIRCRVSFCHCTIAIQFGFPNYIRYPVSFGIAAKFLSLCPMTIAAYSQVIVKCRQISTLVSLSTDNCRLSTKLMRNVGKFRGLSAHLQPFWSLLANAKLHNLCRIRLVRMPDGAKFINNYIWKKKKCKKKINFERKYNILNE